MQVTHKNGIVEERANPIRELLVKYLPFWPLFLTLVVIFGLLSWLYLHFAVPVYQTSATILVKDEKKGVDDANLMEQLDLFGSKKFVENEIEVIQSRQLMREVVKNLSLYAPVTCEQPVFSKPGYVVSPVMILAKTPDTLAEEDKVYFSFDNAKRQVTIGNKKYPINQWINDGANVIKFIPNPNYQAPEENRPLYFSIVGVKVITDEILQGLKVTQATKLASVIDLKVKDPIPKRGEDILNNLISEYNKASISDKNALAYNTLKFINERLTLVVSQLDSMELGIQQYKTKQGIVDVSAQGQLYLTNVGLSDQKLSEINVQLAVMDQVEKYVQSKSNEPGIVPSTFGLNDPLLVELLSKLYDLEMQYNGLRKTTAENNPMISSIREAIEKIKPSILENIKNQRRNLEAGKTDLTRTNNQYSSVLNGLPQKERGLISISRQQTIENGIYSFLLQKKEETALSYNSAIADTRIVDDAQSSIRPVSPKALLVFILGVFAAIGIGAGLVAVREVLNQNILFRSEIESYTEVPVIGEVMYETSGNSLIIQEGRRSYISEQLRQLRTSLTYIGIKNRKKKLLITSSCGSEGKSFISANLGISLALTNKKVVLLELDLRKPALSKLFNIDQAIGITHYLVEEKDADEIILPLDINKNLFIIPSGATPPNPSELLLNGKLEELLKYLETIFDYIIIDSPPISPVTDAYILSPLCDATLFVIRHGVTPKNFIKMLDDNIRIHALKNMAIIFNGVKSRGLGVYGYGYGYTHNGNGNGYFVDDDAKKTKKKSKWAGLF
jgi:tyrosine-protein kinase Etk/Wzc